MSTVKEELEKNQSWASSIGTIPIPTVRLVRPEKYLFRNLFIFDPDSTEVSPSPRDIELFLEDTIKYISELKVSRNYCRRKWRSKEARGRYRWLGREIERYRKMYKEYSQK